jgi:alkyl sulfatase BDS1-like metallo-beta-lactamase superfamily hydrolase
VVNHLVFAEPENQEARELQAEALEQLAYGAENASWRNFLMGAKELREGISGTPTAAPPDADATLIVEHEALNQLLLDIADIGELAEGGRLRVEGDGAKLGELLGLLDEPDPGFAIVTPD